MQYNVLYYKLKDHIIYYFRHELGAIVPKISIILNIELLY